MLFNSYEFLLFFPVVVATYFVIPQKGRYLWLLAASYYFYMGWNAKYALLLLASTVITYICGLILNAIRADRVRARKLVVAAGCVLNLGILFFFKYANFAIHTANRILTGCGLPTMGMHLDVLLPVGISFYTFQAIGYMIDVYRGTVKVEKNFFKYALFVSFFPQLVAGPIERSGHLLEQVGKPHRYDYRNMCEGLLLMIWGYFMKLVIADRIAIFVDHVYDGELLCDGKYLVLATILFAIQIYCDFGGYSTIAVGAAKVMGFDLMENFNCPYFAKTVSEFWKRWHISLSSWFRDYLYIPLGGNRKGKLRKYINIMIVFLTSGLWHGASFTYMIWGGLNGLYQIIGDFLRPLGKRIGAVFHMKEKNVVLSGLKIVVTFVLVDISWVFFRAESTTKALRICERMLHSNQPEFLANGGLFDFGLNQANFIVLGIAIGILFFADVLKYRGICVRERILKQNFVVKSAIAIAGILAILVYGIWGSGYFETNFIYFQF